MARVLVIGDTHAPAMHKNYVSFLLKIYKKYKCNRVVHIGDAVDWSAISFHEKEVDMPNAADEFKAAYKQIQKIYAAFPSLDYLTGNHCSLPKRKAQSIMLPDEVLKDFSSLWGVDGWRIYPRYHDLVIDNVIYRHGDKGKGGARLAALSNAMAEHRSLVQGHLHAQLGIEFAASKSTCIFGMQVGCGTDPDHPNMRYSRVYTQRPLLGCGVVVNGEPFIERMKL